MKAVMVMFDSLRRDLLEPYGCKWTKTPNFTRLAQHCVIFDQSWAGSLPCMPARRELHTGRVNFYHRSWGPVEPYDDSMPQILKQNGIYSHLVSDHQHYWEDGGCTYHNRYSSWECARGQEGDNWKADLSVKYDRKTVFVNKARMMSENPAAAYFYNIMYSHDQMNRNEMDCEEKTSQAVTFSQGLEFIDRNYSQDSWFLQIETFDPHEPFYSLPADKALYPHTFLGDAEMEADWPPYAPVAEDENTIEHVRYEYAALLTKCDRYLGYVLDAFDKYNLWEDTMLIVNTDHGFLLSEHGWWGKTNMPVYTEIGHTPLFIYDPRHKDMQGVRRQALVQTVDLPVTILRYFNLEVPHDMLGHDLEPVIISDKKVRDTAVFGYHGSQVYVTDGHYLYMHSAEHPEMPVYDYTLMPTHMRAMFSPSELAGAELVKTFSFTKGCPVLKIEAVNRMGDTTSFGSALYDLDKDPQQMNRLDDEKLIQHFKEEIRKDMDVNDAPSELYERLGV